MIKQTFLSTLITLGFLATLAQPVGAVYRNGEMRFTTNQQKQASKEAEKTAREENRQQIKEEKRKKAQERINNNLNNLNKRRTTALLNNLKGITTRLEQVQKNSDKLKAKGNDVSSVATAIGAAQSTIDAAHAAITAQAGKTYALETNPDGTLKSDVGQLTTQLKNDLNEVAKQVVAARKAVMAAEVILRHVRKGTTPLITPTP